MNDLIIAKVSSALKGHWANPDLVWPLICPTGSWTISVEIYIFFYWRQTLLKNSKFWYQNESWCLCSPNRLVICSMKCCYWQTQFQKREDAGSYGYVVVSLISQPHPFTRWCIFSALFYSISQWGLLFIGSLCLCLIEFFMFLTLTCSHILLWILAILCSSVYNTSLVNKQYWSSRYILHINHQPSYLIMICWEMRDIQSDFPSCFFILVALSLFLMSVNIKTPVVVENITLMCLRILQKLIKPPAPTSKKNKVNML